MPVSSEKTPSFNVNGDKGFFKCFGCGVGGDVIKFVELYDKVAFPEAVRQLAARVGMTVPEADEAKTDILEQRDREALLKIHEVAAAWFREQLATPAGATARRQLTGRGLTQETIERLGMGYAPAAREGLKARLLKEGFPLPVLLRSGLLVQRDEGAILDRFRNRLMIPIASRQRGDRGVWRPGDGRGAGPEVPELAGNADLRQGADAVRPELEQNRDLEGQVRGAWSRGISTWRSVSRPASPT